MSALTNPTHIIVHTTAAQRDVSIEEVRRWHKQRGWSDVGYHYLIRKDGTVEKGRADNVKGAHCRDMGMNSKALGVCLSGHGDLEPWTWQQTESFARLVRGLMQKHGIAKQNVLGHRETGAPKTCPGTLIDMDHVRALL